MEREEAARTGVPSRVLDWSHFNERAKGDPTERESLIVQHILTEGGVSGTVVVQGRVDAGTALTVLRRVQERLPQIRLQGEADGTSPLGQARRTKDGSEVDHIRSMGKITVEVAAAVVDFLTSQREDGGRLVARSGEPVTVGDVKRRIRLWLAERGAESPEGMIFSVGRDAGIPHSVGRDEDPLPLGVPILLDLFPCQVGGGYFYDFTRTWCLGHAPDEMAELHALVLEAHQQALAGLRPGVSGRSLQERTCDLFESRGHPTLRTDSKTVTGYVHSLGHGVGLSVHEPPAFRLSVEGDETLRPGMVFAVEPGLYYPDRNLGMRIEDTLWLRSDGAAEVLADFPTDLVLPLRARRAARRAPRGRASRRR
jgi:Xaa-Pro aminopeptidase